MIWVLIEHVWVPWKLTRTSEAWSLEKVPKPKLTEESVGKYYAVCYTEPHLTYCWGKLTSVFCGWRGWGYQSGDRYLQRKNNYK